MTKSKKSILMLSIFMIMAIAQSVRILTTTDVRLVDFIQILAIVGVTMILVLELVKAIKTKDE